MRPFNDDIVQFIRDNFQPQDIPRVIEALQNGGPVLSTPRVQRAVLFLSGGSLAMLRHYVATALVDVREILLRAEYVLGVAAEPMPVRDMTQALPMSDRNSSSDRPAAAPPRPAPRHAPRTAPNSASAPSATRHRHLLGGRFLLGQVQYSVTAEQDHEHCVRCLRRHGNVVSIVHLPLVFVMEQLSEERIELQADPH